MRLLRCLLYGFVDYSGFEKVIEVRTATYRPGIDQSQHAKLVSHIIMSNITIVITQNPPVLLEISLPDLLDSMIELERNIN